MKDDINMVNSNHINEIGGAEDNNNKRQFPDAQNQKLTGTAPGGGEFGGTDAITNDVTRYIDFINGKGDYEQAGRDHSFALASLAIVNPMAAGMILGTIGVAAAIHGIATSTFVRTMQAKRRLKLIYDEAKGDGYNPSKYVVGFLGKAWSFGGSKDKDGSSSYGPKPFIRYYTKLIQKFNGDVKSAGILDSNGKYTKTKRDKNQEENYATAGSFVASSIQQFYIPDSIVATQQSVYKGLQSNVSPNARYALTKEYGNLLNIMADAASRTNATPLYTYVADQVKSLKEIGDGVCDAFDKKMGHALKNGRYRATNASQRLKKLWENYMRDITKQYLDAINSLTESTDYIKLRTQVEALSKVCKESEIIEELSNALNVGGLFGRLVDNGTKLQLWKVKTNNASHDRKAVIFPVNVNLLANGSFDRQVLKGSLFDRNKFAHYVEIPFKGDIKVGRVYVLGSNADVLYVVVKEIKTASVKSKRKKSTVKQIFYYVVNFNGSIKSSQIAYIGGSMTGQDFISAIKSELIADPIEVQGAQGKQLLQSGQVGSKEQAKKESIDDKFDKSIVLNEDGEDHDEAQSSDTTSDNNDTDIDPDDVQPYEDMESSEFKDYVYVLPGRYQFQGEETNKEVVTVKEITGGHVEYHIGDGGSNNASFAEWDKKKPLQLPDDSSDMPEFLNTPEEPRDIPDKDKTYSKPKYPLTYHDFYESYLCTRKHYESVLMLHKDDLSKYGLYVKNDEIRGVYARKNKGSDEDFSMHIAYNFTPYIRSLGDAVLFETEEEFNKYKPKEKTNESIVESFSRLMMLNESSVNEASYNSKSVKDVKKHILETLQDQWISIFSKKYDTEKQQEIVTDKSSKRDDILKEIDKEAFNKIIEGYKVHVLTKTLKKTLGDDEYEDLVNRLNHIAKEGPLYHDVDRKSNVNHGVVDKEIIGSTYGRMVKDVEVVPNFEKTAQELADFNKEVQKKCSKLSKEERGDIKNATVESVKTNPTGSQSTNIDNSTTTNVNVNGDGNNTNVNNGDNNVNNNNSGNVTIVNNLNGVDPDSLIHLLFGTEELSDFFGDSDLSNIDDGSDNNNTPVEQPEGVKDDDPKWKQILLTTCADIIDKLVLKTEIEKKAADKILISAMKRKTPEYYTFGTKEKEVLIHKGDDTKISLDTNSSKKLADDVKDKFIIKDGRILAKIIEYNQSEDKFTFITEDGVFTVKGTSTIEELGFDVAQMNTEDIVNFMLIRENLPATGTVLEIPENILVELSSDNNSIINDSVDVVYQSVMKLYEDEGDNNVKYIRVLVSKAKFGRGATITITLEDKDGKEYNVSDEKIKEYGIVKFNKSLRSVKYQNSDDVTRDTKYIVDNDYYNNVIIKQSSTDTASTPLEKEDDEAIIKVLFLNDDKSFIAFKLVSTDKQLSDPIRLMSYLYLDPSKLTKTDKDADETEEVSYNKDEMYIITNYDEVKDLIIEHANESSQEYAYYKLYGMHLNEDDSEKTVVMKIVNVEGEKITFSLSTDNYVKTYTLTKEDLSKFKLEKYDENGEEEETFNPDDYQAWDIQSPYPVDDIKNLAKILETYKQDTEKKKFLTQFIENNRQPITNSGVTGANDDEIIDELIATAHKFSDDHDVTEGGDYNMLYVTPSSGVTNSPVKSEVIHCDKKTDTTVYFSINKGKDKHQIPTDKLNTVYLYPIDEKKVSESLYESVGVTIDRHQYALYKLYGGSLLEAVNINPANPSMMSALINMLLSAYKALSSMKPQQDNTQQDQNQQQQAQQNGQQQNIQTTVGGNVPMTITAGKPVETVDSATNTSNNQ